MIDKSNLNARTCLKVRLCINEVQNKYISSHINRKSQLNFLKCVWTLKSISMKLIVILTVISLALLNHSANGEYKYLIFYNIFNRYYYWFYLEKCDGPWTIHGKCEGESSIAYTYLLKVCWDFPYTGCINNTENVFSSLAECENTCYYRVP